MQVLNNILYCTCIFTWRKTSWVWYPWNGFFAALWNNNATRDGEHKNYLSVLYVCQENKSKFLAIRHEKFLYVFFSKTV